MVQTTGDQFHNSKESGFFVDYNEPKIDFLPTYKLATDKLQYVNKKDQCPSYTDRVLFKNNSSLEVVDDFYQAGHDVFGSDHRPVLRAITIKKLKIPMYANVQRIF